MTTSSDTAAAAAVEAAARELKLPMVRTDAAQVAADAKRAKLSYLGFLAELLGAEVDARTERRRARRIHDAKFPRIKRLADFDLDADLLAYLANNRGLALSRRQLLDAVWGSDWVGDDRTVDVHVRQLRKKLGDDLALETVWGVGYRLD